MLGHTKGSGHLNSDPQLIDDSETFVSVTSEATLKGRGRNLETSACLLLFVYTKDVV